jgi:molybdopterin synthase catalytic subunit
MTVKINVSIRPEDFSVDQAYQWLSEQAQGIGAVALFVGKVRDHQRHQEVTKPISSLSIEHYPGMTEKSLRDAALAASTRWPLLAINIIHRIGELLPDDQIVLVGVASSHRAEAFSACEMIMDTLKTTAPFWKKTMDGDNTAWVSANEADQLRAARWQRNHFNHRGFKRS